MASSQASLPALTVMAIAPRAAETRCNAGPRQRGFEDPKIGWGSTKNPPASSRARAHNQGPSREPVRARSGSTRTGKARSRRAHVDPLPQVADGERHRDEGTHEAKQRAPAARETWRKRSQPPCHIARSNFIAAR